MATAVLYIWKPTSNYQKKSFKKKEKRHGHAALEVPFNENFTTGDYQKVKAGSKLYISLNQMAFANRISDFKSYRRYELRIYQLELSDKNIDQMGKEFVKKYPHIEHILCNPGTSDNSQYNFIDLDARNRRLYHPIGQNHDFFRCPTSIAYVNIGENCTSLINKLLLAAEKKLNFLTCRAVTPFIILMCLEGCMGAYNLEAYITHFGAHPPRGSLGENINAYATYIASALLLAEFFLICYRFFRRIKQITNWDITIKLFYGQIVFTSVAFILDICIDGWKEVLSYTAIGAIIGISCGLIEFFFPLIQLMFAAVYYPQTLDELMEKEAEKSGEDAWVRLVTDNEAFLDNWKQERGNDIENPHNEPSIEEDSEDTDSQDEVGNLVRGNARLDTCFSFFRSKEVGPETQKLTEDKIGYQAIN